MSEAVGLFIFEMYIVFSVINTYFLYDKKAYSKTIIFCHWPNVITHYRTYIQFCLNIQCNMFPWVVKGKSQMLNQYL